MVIDSSCTCLVTGGAGFIGSHLVDLLLSRQCTVRVLDSLASGSRENLSHHFNDSRFSLIEGSILVEDDVRRALHGVNVVFHLACLGVRHSLVDPIANHEVNARGTLNVLDEALRVKATRFVYCSSSEVYGTALTVPMDELHPTFPCTVYGGSKLAGEAYARAYHLTFGLPTTVVRPFNTYGPRSHHERELGEFIPKSIVRALAGKPILIFGDGSITRDFTYVTDTAQGILAAAEDDTCVGMTFNLGSGAEISLRNLGQRIVDLIGNPSSGIQLCDERPGDVLRLFANPTAARKKGILTSPISFEIGLARTIEYFKNHPKGLDVLIAEEGGRSWENSSRFR